MNETDPTGAPQPPTDAVPPVVEDAVRRTVRRDERGHLAEDVLCRQCGYNLRGLAADAVCPECSLSVDRSIRHDLLKYANPEWVGRLSRGVLLAIIGLLSSVGVAIIGGVVMMLVFAMVTVQTGPAPGGAPALPNPFSSPSFAIAAAAMALCAVACMLLFVYGVWLLTTPDPSRVAEERTLSPRRLARWCVLASVLAAPTQVLSQGSGWGGFGSGVGIGPLFYYILLGSAIIGMVVVVGYVAGLFYLRDLALRLPQANLARHAKIVGWGWGVAQGLASVFGLLMLLLMPAMMTAAGMAAGTMTPSMGLFFAAAGIGGCAAGVGTLIFGIWGIVVLFLFRSAFSKARAAAAENWGADGVDSVEA